MTEEHKEKIRRALKGRKLSAEHKQKIKEGIANSDSFKAVDWSSLQKELWSTGKNKGMTGKVYTEEKKEQWSEMAKSHDFGKWMQGKKLTPEHIRNALKHRAMSSAEVAVQKVIQDNDLPFRYVGNGGFFIEGKVPDFIDEQDKIAVEVFYRRHKDAFRGGWKVWQNERERIFMAAGWRTIFINETQIANTHFLLQEALK